MDEGASETCMEKLRLTVKAHAYTATNIIYRTEYCIREYIEFLCVTLHLFCFAFLSNFRIRYIYLYINTLRPNQTVPHQTETRQEKKEMEETNKQTHKHTVPATFLLLLLVMVMV